MSKLQDLVTEDRRLRILQLLEDSTGYSASASLLHTVLSSIGHGVSYDRVTTDLAWLREQDLIFLETIGTVVIAKLSQRGRDALVGNVAHPGVARPRPE